MWDNPGLESQQPRQCHRTSSQSSQIKITQCRIMHAWNIKFHNLIKWHHGHLASHNTGEPERDRAHQDQTVCLADLKTLRNLPHLNNKNSQRKSATHMWLVQLQTFLQRITNGPFHLTVNYDLLCSWIRKSDLLWPPWSNQKDRTPILLLLETRSVPQLRWPGRCIAWSDNRRMHFASRKNNGMYTTPSVQEYKKVGLLSILMRTWQPCRWRTKWFNGRKTVSSPRALICIRVWCRLLTIHRTSLQPERKASVVMTTRLKEAPLTRKHRFLQRQWFTRCPCHSKPAPLS